MFNEDEFRAVASLLKSGVLFSNHSEDFPERMLSLIKKCTIQPTDDRTTQIFKYYLMSGSVGNFNKSRPIKVKKGELSDTLFYKQANDIEITLLAKILYSECGTPFNEFLKWQVNVILKQGFIDVENEFIKFWDYNDITGKDVSKMTIQELDEIHNQNVKMSNEHDYN